MAETKAKVGKAEAEPKQAAPRSCESCSRWKEVQRRMRIGRVIKNAVRKFEAKLKEKDFKPSVAEYLRLVQMEQDFDKDFDGPREITVTWVEQPPTSENSK